MPLTINMTLLFVFHCQNLLILSKIAFIIDLIEERESLKIGTITIYDYRVVVQWLW